MTTVRHSVLSDHARQFDELRFVYPVVSRRSKGLSLGVNLNPDKVCNFHCPYCQVDRTTPGRDLEVNFRAVLRANLARLDLVTRDEFDAQARVLERTRAKLEALEAQVAALEGRAGGGGG